MKSSYIIIDFETTGLSPNMGERAIEVAAVLVKNGRVEDKYQSLMNPGKKISTFIESYTGISNSMIKKAPTNAIVMKELSQFIGKTPLIAHNASFDKKFLEHELRLIGKKVDQPIACSLLLARRIYQNAPNHKLQTLVELNNIRLKGEFHRALADAEMTAYLWLKMRDDLSQNYGIDVNFDLMHSLMSIPKADIAAYLNRLKMSKR